MNPEKLVIYYFVISADCAYTVSSLTSVFIYKCIYVCICLFITIKGVK